MTIKVPEAVYDEIVAPEKPQSNALGLLLIAKQEEKIAEVAPYIRKLRQSSIYYDDALLDRVLKLAGE